MGIGWKSFEMGARRNGYSCKYLKVILIRTQKKESCRESFLLLREYLITHEVNVGVKCKV